MKTIHPIGKAIVNSLPYVNAQKIFDMKELPGVGLMTSGFVLGSEKSVLGKAYSDEMKKFMNEHSSSTLVFLSDQSTILMILSLEDILVPDSKDTISALKKDGIKSYMLTGDRKEYALKTGKELGLEEKQIYSEASPLDKAKILEEIKKENGVICYIGDGINDTLALKASNLSFAPSGASDAAKNSADGIILSPNLMSVEYALLISKKTYLNIIENFCWAICYNAAMIPLAIIGILPMYLCAVMMIVSNLTLTINSLRMRLYHPNKGEVK
jgi:P-type E1-E2 ATPase